MHLICWVGRARERRPYVVKPVADDSPVCSSYARGLVRRRTTVSLTPIAWRYALPCAECATERVWIFKAKQIRGFIQLQDGIGEVVPCHLMSSFIQNPL